MENIMIVTSISLLIILPKLLVYIDPGTGSIILQAVVASVVGAAVAVKLFWHRILKFLGIRKSTETDPSKKTGDKAK